MNEQAGMAREHQNVRRRRRIWYCSYVAWQAMAWFMLAAIAGGSAYVASSSFKDSDKQAALGVAILSAVLTVFQPQRRANAYRQAWMVLDLTIKKQAKVQQELLLAVEDGEAFISDVHSEKRHQDRKMKGADV